MKYMLKANSGYYRHYGNKKFDLVAKQGHMANLTHITNGNKSGVCFPFSDLILLNAEIVINEHEVILLKRAVSHCFITLDGVHGNEQFLNKLRPLAKKLGVKYEY